MSFPPIAVTFRYRVVTKIDLRVTANYGSIIMQALPPTQMRRKQMATFEIQVSGSIIIEAETEDKAFEQLNADLANVLTDWEVEWVK